MILNREYAPPRSTRETIAAYLADEIRAAMPGGVSLSPETLGEVARGVAAYLADDNCAAFRANTERMLRLTSTALCSLGETALARRLVVFGSGLAQCATWEISGQNTMLVLDLKRLACRQEACLELTLFRSLGATLEAIADVWDESGGRGVLALRHLGAVVRAVLGPVRRRAAAGFSVEILGQCRRKLEQIQAARRWRQTPHVIVLDAADDCKQQAYLRRH